MPLGNDVVDLAHPQNRPEAIHPRFDTRVFTPRELDELDRADDRHLLRWTLWAAKEAAFKAARQIDPTIRLLPREFDIVRVDGRFEVVHAAGRFATTVERSADWVHVAAHPPGIAPALHLEAMAAREGDESRDGTRLRDASGSKSGAEGEPPSQRARHLARTCLGEGLGLAPEEIHIVSVDRIPRAERRGAPLPVDLSLSHDGRFVACAWRALRSGGSSRGAAGPCAGRR